MFAQYRKKLYLSENTRESNKRSGWENGPDGNAAVYRDVDSGLPKGKPAWGGHDFFPLSSAEPTGDRRTSRQAGRQTER